MKTRITRISHFVFPRELRRAHKSNLRTMDGICVYLCPSVVIFLSSSKKRGSDGVRWIVLEISTLLCRFLVSSPTKGGRQMNSDNNVELTDGQSGQFLLKEETGRIIGCAIEVLNEIGHGLHEKVYENALVVEFGIRGISSDQQRRFDVMYKRHPVGYYVPDLIAFGQVIVDAKTIEKISEEERGKMINYLKVTGLRVGLILNFKHPKLGIERLIR